jgi:hypothetical protein
MILPINILVDSVNNSQEAFLAIQYANTLNDDGRYTVNLFIQNEATPVISINAGIFPLEKSLTQKGLTIATSFATAKFLPSCVADYKIFYITEPVWLFEKIDYLKVFNTINKSDKIVCQSDFHNKCIKTISNRESDAIIPLFNLPRIINEFCINK